ncbi:MAG: hypothetical protein K2X66_07425 [Cyanobacteria bacterium]|nr:hypothetical protein [Cyanobacteriota bacterium]
MMISLPAQSVLYAVITKSVGSGFRVLDERFSPPDKQLSAIKREGVLLGVTTLLTTGIQFLFTTILSSTLKKKPVLAHHELLLRAVMTAPALIFAEWLSREMVPKNRHNAMTPLADPSSKFSVFMKEKQWGTPLLPSTSPALNGSGTPSLSGNIPGTTSNKVDANLPFRGGRASFYV